MDARPLSPDEKLARRANLRSPEDGGIAQLVERLVRNEKARGSNPLTSTSPPRKTARRFLAHEKVAPLRP